MGNRQSSSEYPEAQLYPSASPQPPPRRRAGLFGLRKQVEEGQDGYSYPEPMGGYGRGPQDSRKERGMFSLRRQRSEARLESPPVVALPGPPKQPYLSYLSTRPHIQVHRPLPPSSSMNPISPSPPPLGPVLVPLTSACPSYTPSRFLHPEPTVRLPKPGTWLLGTLRSGGAGLKRGEVEGMREGLKEVRRGRKEARDAERLRRMDDAAREYSALKVQTEQDLYKASRPRRSSRRGRQTRGEEAYLPDQGGYHPSADQGYQAHTQAQVEAQPTTHSYGNIPTQAETYPAMQGETQTRSYSDPHHQPYEASAAAHDYTGPMDDPASNPRRGRSIWTRDRWTRVAIEPEVTADSPAGGRPQRQAGGFRLKHGMRHVDAAEVRDY